MSLLEDGIWNEAGTDNFLCLLMGGLARAEERHRSKLRTVDEHGNPIDTATTTGTDTPPPFGILGDPFARRALQGGKDGEE